MVCRFAGLAVCHAAVVVGERNAPTQGKGCSWCGRNGGWIFEILSLETKNKS